jgi:hypothetical protein
MLRRSIALTAVKQFEGHDAICRTTRALFARQRLPPAVSLVGFNLVVKFQTGGQTPRGSLRGSRCIAQQRRNGRCSIMEHRFGVNLAVSGIRGPIAANVFRIPTDHELDGVRHEFMTGDVLS